MNLVMNDVAKFSDLDLVVFSTNNAGLGGNVDQENFTTTDKIQLSR